jgi:hypothetical protein
MALIAAGLLLAGVFLAAAGRAAQTPTAKHAVCSATDRQFLTVANTTATSVMLVGEDFVQGQSTAAEAIGEAKRSALRIQATAPQDRALKNTKFFLHGMFTEYGKAIRAQSNGGDAGKHMFRAYTYANYAHDELAGAASALKREGCDVRPLL